MKKTIVNTLETLNIKMRNRESEDYKFVSTGLQAYIFTDYKKIVKLFGKPNTEGDGYKVDAEWEFEMNGKVMTIYNYKDGKNYNGKSGLPVSKIKEWHIGSNVDITKEVETLSTALEGKLEKK